MKTTSKKTKDFTKKQKSQMKSNLFAILKDRYYDIIMKETYFPDFGIYTNWDGSVDLGQIKDLEFRYNCVCALEIYKEYARYCPLNTGSLENIHMANFLADVYNELKISLLCSGHPEADIFYKVID